MQVISNGYDYRFLLYLERIKKPKNFPMVYLIVSKILRIVIADYGTLYVTYPVYSSNIDGLYGVILP